MFSFISEEIFATGIDKIPHGDTMKNYKGILQGKAPAESRVAEDDAAPREFAEESCYE